MYSVRVYTAHCVIQKNMNPHSRIVSIIVDFGETIGPEKIR